MLSGAGMSAESGIPTFRGAQNGLWSRFDPEDLATADAFRRDKALVWGWYVWRMAFARAANPHAGHMALAKLGSIKPDLAIITQNVDDLHERAGSWQVLHLHGSLFAPRCFACARPFEGFEIPESVADLRLEPPRCTHCGGYVRPGVVWFGESVTREAWKAAEAHARQCDLMVVVGTSGVVHPAALLPAIAKESGARVVEINPISSAVSGNADLAWRSSAAIALPALVEALESNS